ncbi:MAG: quaternary ammonium compound efflux SMR transporter SugE [Rhodocyclaceae bacterium]|nr:quaternary ammonium compound efflux SMR transporter SugE [Rhodocyclaceae bacterium]
MTGETTWLPTPTTAVAWWLLVAAGFCEVAWAIGLKYADGFTRLLPSLWTLAMMVASIVLLAWAVRVLPVGTAYAVWTGIGAAGTALLGIWLFDEPRDAMRLISLLLIVAGIIGLKLGAR